MTVVPCTGVVIGTPVYRDCPARYTSSLITTIFAPQDAAAWFFESVRRARVRTTAAGYQGLGP